MKTTRISALTAGVAILSLSVLAAFTFGYIHNTLVVPDHPGATVNNIRSSGGLFLTEIMGWLFILVLDVVVAWALYLFFKNENRKLSVLTAGLRFIYAAILSIAVFNFIRIINILDGNMTITGSMNNIVMSLMESFEMTWSFGLIIFGFHLLLLGTLALKSQYIHRFWGITLVFAAVSYLTIHGSILFFPEFGHVIKTVELILSLPMAFGEIGFAFWLIIRGGKQFKRPDIKNPGVRLI